MLTKTSISAAIGGIILIGAGSLGDGTILDQTPASFYARMKGALKEYVDPDGYYKSMVGGLGNVHRLDGHSRSNHIASIGDSYLNSNQREVSQERESSQYTAEGYLTATRFDPKCPNKECDSTTPAIPNQQELDKQFRESLADPTFKEALEPQTPAASEEPPPQYAQRYIPPYQWHHYSRGIGHSTEIEYVPSIPNEWEPPTRVNTPGTFYLSILGVISLSILRLLNSNK